MSDVTIFANIHWLYHLCIAIVCGALHCPMRHVFITSPKVMKTYNRLIVITNLADSRLKNKNIERHTADTIVSWPKQWLIVHTYDLMMIIRQSIYILSMNFMIGYLIGHQNMALGHFTWMQLCISSYLKMYRSVSMNDIFSAQRLNMLQQTWT